MARITTHLYQLKKLTYGKHIVARVEKLLVAGNAAAVQQVSHHCQSTFRMLCCCLLDYFQVHSAWLTREVEPHKRAACVLATQNKNHCNFSFACVLPMCLHQLSVRLLLPTDHCEEEGSSVHVPSLL